MTLHTITAAKDDDKYPAASKKLAAILSKLLEVKPGVENPDDPEEERYQAYQFELSPSVSPLEHCKKSAKVVDYLEKQGYGVDSDDGDLIVYSDEKNGTLVYVSLDRKDTSTPWVEVLRD